MKRRKTKQVRRETKALKCYSKLERKKKTESQIEQERVLWERREVQDEKEPRKQEGAQHGQKQERHTFPVEERS